MSNKNGFFEVDAATSDKISSDCERAGGVVFCLKEKNQSKEDFFDAIRKTLPLDPPLQSNRSWDALSDSLWSGLDGLPDNPIVIIWENSCQMEISAPEDFRIALEILKDLAESLTDMHITDGKAKNLSVLRVI